MFRLTSFLHFLHCLCDLSFQSLCFIGRYRCCNRHHCTVVNTETLEIILITTNCNKWSLHSNKMKKITAFFSSQISIVLFMLINISYTLYLVHSLLSLTSQLCDSVGCQRFCSQSHNVICGDCNNIDFILVELGHRGSCRKQLVLLIFFSHYHSLHACFALVNSFNVGAEVVHTVKPASTLVTKIRFLTCDWSYRDEYAFRGEMDTPPLLNTK